MGLGFQVGAVSLSMTFHIKIVKKSADQKVILLEELNVIR